MSRKIEVEIFTDYEPGHCTIATIMARGRGTTLHAKNSFKIAGKPLMEWFLDEITQAECIDYTFVWTESEEIAEITTKYRNVHAIRHTYATRMIMAGANLVYVQKQLGHSTIQLTVDTYTHWIEEVERGSILEVDRLLGNSQSLSLDSNRI